MKAIINAARREPVLFNLDGRELEITMSLAAISEIQEAYGDLGAALDKTTEKDGIRVLVNLLTILMNDAVEDHNDAYPADPWPKYTERQISKRFGVNDVNMLRDLIGAVISGGLPEPDVAGAEVPDEMRELLSAVEVEEDPEGKN